MRISSPRRRSVKTTNIARLSAVLPIARKRCSDRESGKPIPDFVPSFEAVAHVRECDHERHRFYRGRIKAEAEIKHLSLSRNSMYQNPADADGFGRMHNTSCTVTHERPAEATALICTIDGQSRKHSDRDRDRVWHIAPETSRCRSDAHRSGGQGIITNDFVRLTNDEGARGAAGLIGKCAPFEPIVEGSYTRVEIPNLMLGAKRLGSGERHVHSQGAEVRMVRRNRSFGCGGASKRARNSA